MSEDLSGNLRLWAEVRGHVQGVGFRQFVLNQASKLGLKGWVRNNRYDRNRVELEAEGPKPQLEALVARLKDGSYGYHVQDVSTYWCAASGEYHAFEIRYL